MIEQSRKLLEGIHEMSEQEALREQELEALEAEAAERSERRTRKPKMKVDGRSVFITHRLANSR